MQATITKQLAVAVAEHRSQEQGWGEATANKAGGIADTSGQKLDAQQYQQGEQGHATLAAKQGLNRVVADTQHLGKTQSHHTHRGTP